MHAKISFRQAKFNDLLLVWCLVGKAFGWQTFYKLFSIHEKYIKIYIDFFLFQNFWQLMVSNTTDFNSILGALALVYS